jgi:hypothetical protein
VELNLMERLISSFEQAERIQLRKLIAEKGLLLLQINCECPSAAFAQNQDALLAQNGIFESTCHDGITSLCSQDTSR